MKFNVGDKVYAIHYNYEYGTVQEIIGEGFYQIVFNNGDYWQVEEKFLRYYGKRKTRKQRLKRKLLHVAQRRHRIDGFD